MAVDVVRRVQTRLAKYGQWDQVSVSDTSLGLGQWLFRIARGPFATVFAVPSAAATEAEVDELVDRAVAQIGSRENGH